MTEPIIEPARGISPVWLLPFLALCIGGWLLYQSLQSRGIEVTIHFKDVSGITSGKTMVIYKGLPVGTVQSMQVDPAVQAVDVVVKMESMMKNALVEDTAFWVVRPELSADRVSGLDTILSGSYISLQPGASEKQQRTFTALDHPPPLPANSPGLHLLLKADSLSSLQEGSGVYYRHIEIGTIQRFELEGDNTVDLEIHIEEQYRHLVKEGSRFWNASGITATGGLSGIKIHMESLSSMIRGGIVMETPDALKEGPGVQNGHVFQLYKDFEAAEYGIPITLQLATGEGMVEGSTKVMYRGMQAGIVQKVEINEDASHSVTAHILLDPRAEVICREGTRFWLVRPQLDVSRAENLGTLITGPYITFSLGEGKPCKQFTALHVPPPAPVLRPGNSFLLVSASVSALSAGAPLLHKTVQIGEVSAVSLESSGQEVRVSLFVYEEYARLITRNSVFFEISPLQLKIGGNGLTMEMGTMSNFIHGGIELLNPGNPDGESVAEEGQSFPLYGSRNEAIKSEKTLLPLGLPVILEAAELGSLRLESPILFKQIPIGEVSGFRLAGNGGNVLVEALIHKQYQHLVNSGTRFYNLSGISMKAGLQQGFSLRTESLASIVDGGIGCFTPEGGPELPSGHHFPLYPNLEDAQIAGHAELTVRAESSHGLQAGSPVKYEGITIGQVRTMDMEVPQQLIILRIAVEQKYRDLFRQKTVVWAAEPQLGLFGSRNLDTVVAGSYLAIRPGGGPLTGEFALLEKEPGQQGEPGSLHLTLESQRCGSLKPGSPVMYRQVRVGTVLQLELAEDFERVLVHATIDRPYRKLIRPDTKFWHASGIRVSGGVFSGMEVSLESMEALLGGGIALASPPERADDREIVEGARFALHAKPDDIWLEWLGERHKEATGGG